LTIFSILKVLIFTGGRKTFFAAKTILTKVHQKSLFEQQMRKEIRYIFFLN
jgi:hypothetical protein